MKKLIKLLLLLPGLALAQPRLGDVEVEQKQAYSRNFAPNPSAAKNILNWTGTSVTVARDTDAADAFDGIASFSLSAATNPATFCTADIAVAEPYDDGVNGEVSVYFKGDASKWQFEVRSSGGSTVLADVDLRNETVWKRASLNYPMADSYRICVSSNAASPAAINLAGFYWGPATNLTTVDPITGWESFTPTGSWSTNTTYTGKRRRVGDMLEAEVYITLAGAPTSASLTVNLPTGLTIDTTKFQGAALADVQIGTATVRDEGTDTFTGIVAYESTTAVRVDVLLASGTYTGNRQVTQILPQTFANTDKILLKYSVPIVGWQAEIAVRPEQAGLTPWVAFTPSFSSATNATMTAEARRVGDSLEIRGRALWSGAGGAGTFTLTLPSVCGGACTIDTTKVSSSQDQILGPALFVDVGGGTVTNTMSVAVNSTTSVAFYIQGGGVRFAANAAGASDTLTFHASMPIVGWTQTMPAPLLVGSVTSNASGLERSERARITGVCGIASQSGSWISSISGSGSGTGCSITMATGQWSAAPVCTLTSEFAATAAVCRLNAAPTTTALAVNCFLSTTAANSDAAFHLHCQGAR